MGQRLVVNIKSGDETIANAYYHWSGYTMCAMEIMLCMISKGIKPLEDLSENKQKAEAIKMLVNTGGSLSVETRDIVEQNKELHDLIDDEETFAEPDRNRGLIAIEEQCENNLSYAEGIVDVYPDKGYFDMGDMVFGSSASEDSEEVKFALESILIDEGIENIDDDEVPKFFEMFGDKIKNANVDLYNIKFDDAKEVAEELNKCSGYYFFINGERDVIYSMIE